LIQIIFLWFGFEINNRSYLLRYASACFGCSSNIKLARGPRQGTWLIIKLTCGSPRDQPGDLLI